ncbi:CLUMA_CG012501, isoform A [Clunio marinus]|uniref:CLUMA_CG012501, isoform A n=1 Tax=Clunio marinus TaxID=568069 RepID=A0A1J1IJE5_9DIPT|nr:CLUMA_CG012501, isoform A [Clunio marinus]
MNTPGTSVSGYVLLLTIQFVFLVVFGICTGYDDDLRPRNGTQAEEGFIIPKYPHFQDIHVMIFIGFGFLMTFLKRYGYSATGLNLFVAALCVQWAILMRGFFDMENGIIKLSLDDIIGADIATASVLISMGALLGRITPIQLLIMGLFEIVLFATNEFLQIELMKIVDIGGSITVHAFGAYFGLAVSFALRPTKENAKAGELEGASYTSDIFAMVGSVFLWIFWPSFNSALVDGPEQERAILHTYLSLAACTVTTFVVSALVSKDNKLDMVHVQNSTLAGGVAVGSVVNLLIHPVGAVVIGTVAGALSVVGYRYLSPKMLEKGRIADTCGVHNLHGMPAVASAIFSAIFAYFATKDAYGDSLYTIFPGMKNSSMEEGEHEIIIGGFGRSSQQQAGYQLLGILITLSIAIVGGLFTGLALKLPNFKQLQYNEMHKDDVYWETPDGHHHEN